MDIETLESFAAAFVDSPANRIDPAMAKEAWLAGQSIFAYPLIGVASATDELLLNLGNMPLARLPLRPPRAWLSEAQTVLSFFFPISQAIRQSNVGGSWPSWGWLQARIEGQQALDNFSASCCEFLIDRGIQALAPSIDPGFRQVRLEDLDDPLFATCNWSERHVAYACGLGTFSLSKGLITAKGVAGRLCSIICSLDLPATARAYQTLDEYCSKCGKCARNCPVDAIGPGTLKNDKTCYAMLAAVLDANAPYYGCGKCQVGVPCEERRPGAAGST